jgi:limonene-1,2-epoxide hydrolase
VEPSEVVAEFWRRIQARDWGGVSDLLAEEVVIEWPNALVQMRGRANVVDFNRSYPEGWSIEVRRIVAEGNTVASEVRVPHPTVGPHYVLAIYELDANRIVRGREYWSEERFEEPSGDRVRWFEPL